MWLLARRSWRADSLLVVITWQFIYNLATLRLSIDDLIKRLNSLTAMVILLGSQSFDHGLYIFELRYFMYLVVGYTFWYKVNGYEWTFHLRSHIDIYPNLATTYRSFY